MRRLILLILSALPLLAIVGCGEDEPADVYTWLVYRQPTVGGAVLSGLGGTGPRDVWAVGSAGTLLHYDGSTWQLYPLGVTDRDLHAVAMTTADSGWAVGEGGLILQYVGGTWFTSSQGDGRDLNAVASVTYNRAVAVGNGGAIYQFDGQEWKDVAPASVTTDLRGVALDTDGTGWAVGDRGLILRYGGDAWTQVSSPTDVRLNAVYITGDGAYAAGDDGVVLHFDGSQWRRMTTPTERELLAIAFSPAGTAFACGNDATLLGMKEGVWGRVDIGFDELQPNNLNAVVLWNSGEGWAVGDQGMILRYGRPW